LPDAPPKTVREITLPVGVVIRRSPSVSRWATWAWKVVDVLPGAAPADWRVLREEDGVTEYHAATLPLTLHRRETEAYRVALAMDPPSVYVVLRPAEPDEGTRDYTVFLVTASSYEAQDYLDSGEEIVEQVPAPPGLVAWIRDFVDEHHVEEEFRKRRRDRIDTDLSEDGKGDARVRQTADVFRPPGALKPKGPLH